MAQPVSNARLREALNAGGPGTSKEKGPPVADGVLSVTPDTPEAAEWRTRQSAIDFPSSSSSYLEEDDDGTTSKPADLYGKFTWKIENFSDISKRELRSNVFEVGSYKWYILVYPQGCDVCNHLSLFLCVADYDKLLPGWSHFAQFTIAVVNKDPKKSKYSDTLHRFCKKEHDWGWKKFMELSKVLDGFTVADTLVIKAQVQVIKDRVSRPFRCLDPQYRRELVRVYLTNVESICRRFVDQRRERFAMLRENPEEFREFWEELPFRRKQKLSQERSDMILKGVVKHFFNEKEVTSTLVMDALYSGCRAMEEHSRQWMAKGEIASGSASMEPPCVVIDATKGQFSLGDNVLEALERAANETIPPFRDDKSPDGLGGRNNSDDDYGKDSVDRDERRLAELGRRTVEMYVMSHVYTENLEVSYREEESLKRQEALIREEEEKERIEDERAQARQAADKERKNRKKERKAKRKEQKEAEEAERKRQEEEMRAAAEEKAREVAEKKRLSEEAAAAKERSEAADKSSSSSAAAAPSQPIFSAPKKASAAQKKAVPLPESSNGGISDGSMQLAKAPCGRSADRASPEPSNQPAADSSSEQPSSKAAHEGDTPDTVMSSAPNSTSTRAVHVNGDDQPGSSQSLEEEVVSLREQLQWMEALLKERDAEIFALRVQLEELSSRPGDAAAAAAGELGTGRPLSRSSQDGSKELPPIRSAGVQAQATPGKAGDPPSAALQEGRGGRAKRAAAERTAAGSGSGKYAAVAAATAAAQAALHSRQVPGSGTGPAPGPTATSVPAVGAGLASGAAPIRNGPAAGSQQQQQPASAARSQQALPAAGRQQSQQQPQGNGPGSLAMPGRQQPAAGAAAASTGSSAAKQQQAMPPPPPATTFPSTTGPPSSGMGHHMNGSMMGMPASSAAAAGGGSSAGGSALVNGVPSYRNAALGQVPEGLPPPPPPCSVAPPPPPPPVPLSPSASGLQQQPPPPPAQQKQQSGAVQDVGPAPATVQRAASSENSDPQHPQFSGIMMRGPSSAMNHYGTPMPKVPPTGGAMPTSESPGLEEFAHMGLINDLLDF
mmetsp:Transcript_12537/g.35224  ORF Transcript_12537/g.35224 Transcript_12537/m.35224 type:complete len:1065 (+) Transcript_12537:198-3392(+)|eukprot:CAMPEP_0117669860 /NCGR_PEP_ID=MMETSP0804-20121206/12388_1 /TAXON_ID=1074897 /ORGANISM="Tetraselmis astigmatica, Strain CCMP880" /LENGTH=1064 /DNA_ID=CAMNT_0005478007 /DNA_START=84 /DNA_END=3278 /DNA_ORIENTATION=+